MQENQRVRLSKKMLKDSLTHLLRKESIHKISVRDICNGAEINRTTFYKYYGSQYDLLADMENDILELVNDYLSADEGISDIAGRLTKVLTFINENIELCRILVNNNVDVEFPNKLIQLPIVQQLVARQLPKDYSEDERAYIYNFLTNGGFSMIRKWINKELREAPDELAAFFSDTILRLFLS